MVEVKEKQNTKEFNRLFEKSRLSIKELTSVIGRNRVTVWRYRNAYTDVPVWVIMMLKAQCGEYIIKIKDKTNG